ncbi:cytochrome c oxidase assembly factor 8 [Chanos chanos]|uniref:Cytochrome c oxidase assembly factor 8 n=1 Tax=Chanos chanos TaxID=29144 RepID=A0A6J2V9N6_CHACN|nr:apoptogenic protein 1, mitochondrial [Chanos chanos]
MNVITTRYLFCRSLGPRRTLNVLRLWNLSCCHQHSGSKAPKEESKPEGSRFSPAASSKCDWIGPPDRLSNLRPVIYHIPENETKLERKLRHLRQETEDWNHDFWTNQNITFSQKKEEYIQSQLKAKGLTERDEKGRKRTLNSEEMAAFYKDFLDRNYKRHADYNIEWYRRNFTITMLMARVAMHKAWRRLTGQGREGRKNQTTT